MGARGKQTPVGSQLKGTIFIVYIQLLCMHIYGGGRTGLVNAPMYFFLFQYYTSNLCIYIEFYEGQIQVGRAEK